MATIRNRRAEANPPTYAVDQDGDRVYTEEDYAAKEPLPEEWEAEDVYAGSGWTGENLAAEEDFAEENFAPDEDFPEEFTPEEDYEGEAFAPIFTGETDYTDNDDPLDDELLTDEERAELRRSRWQLIAGLADFAGVILGTAAILVLVALLVSLLNWLVSDVSQSFILLQKNL